MRLLLSGMRASGSTQLSLANERSAVSCPECYARAEGWANRRIDVSFPACIRRANIPGPLVQTIRIL